MQLNLYYMFSLTSILVSNGPGTPSGTEGAARTEWNPGCHGWSLHTGDGGQKKLGVCCIRL